MILQAMNFLILLESSLLTWCLAHLSDSHLANARLVPSPGSFPPSRSLPDGNSSTSSSPTELEVRPGECDRNVERDPSRERDRRGERDRSGERDRITGEREQREEFLGSSL